MTTSDREKLARKWAERVKAVPEINYGPEANAAADLVMATTAPATMADVEWDAEKHHLAGAVFQNVGMTAEVVMLRKDVSGALIAVAVEGGRPFIGDASKYTPNGKRYELREVTEPDHPEVLETVEDYRDAPYGTVVAKEESVRAFTKVGAYWYIAGRTGLTENDDLAGTPRTVLRWGGEA